MCDVERLVFMSYCHGASCVYCIFSRFIFSGSLIDVLFCMYAHWCISAVMCDVERLVFMALPAATANLGQPSANHIAGNHNQETSLSSLDQHELRHLQQ